MAKRGTTKGSTEGVYLKPNVFFDRFCFDIVSLLGDNLNLLNFTDVEYIMRRVYQASTHFFLPHPGSSNPPQVRLLRYDCVESPFSWDQMAAFDTESINKMLNRPLSPEQQPPPPQKEAHATDDDEAFLEVE